MKLKPYPKVTHKTYGEGEITSIDYFFERIYVMFPDAWDGGILEVAIEPEELEFIYDPDHLLTEALKALRVVKKIAEDVDSPWWMDIPDRGGIDIDKIDQILSKHNDDPNK